MSDSDNPFGDDADDQPFVPCVFLDGLPAKHPPSGDKPTEGLCTKCSKVHLLCPECGSYADSGYGFAGGGIGGYYFCHNDACDYFHKEQDADAQLQEPQP